MNEAKRLFKLFYALGTHIPLVRAPRNSDALNRSRNWPSAASYRVARERALRDSVQCQYAEPR